MSLSAARLELNRSPRPIGHPYPQSWITPRIELRPSPARGLWLALHFPNLSLDVALRGVMAPERPTVVHDGDSHQRRIILVDPQAARLGIAPGMALDAAHALTPDLLALARDPRAEAGALERLASWCGQFTPAVSIAAPDGLLLDVAASLRLFGGAHALSHRIRQDIAATGYRVDTAMAPTALAALWLSRAGQKDDLPVCPWHLASRIGPLPIDVLDLPLAQQRRLRSLGIDTIAGVLRLPRAGLTHRFGTTLLNSLDRALGRVADVRKRHEPPPCFQAAVDLPTETAASHLLLFAAERLLQELAGCLRSRCGGVRHMVWTLQHPGQPASRIRFDLRQPVHDTPSLLALLRERLGRLHLPCPVSALGLITGPIESRPDTSAALLPGNEHCTPEQIDALVDRLRARLGDDAVCGLQAAPRHRPEYAWRFCPPGQRTPAAGRTRRPLWLLASPRQLRTVNERPYLDSLLTPEDGAERIESGWWDGVDIARDYYIARNARGVRLWIFRDLRAPGQWFIHGIFG